MLKNLLIGLFFVLFSSQIFSQTKGGNTAFNPDTVFIFKSPRKLLTLSEEMSNYTQAAALDLLFSNYGFAVGVNYQSYLSKDFALGIKFFISGARSTDEYEYYDYVTGERVVPDKVNRLFLMPLIISARQFLFSNSLDKSFKPYVAVGAGPAFILSTPYSKSFLSAFSYAQGYVKPALSAAIGGVIGSETKSYMSINIDYYYIPFGKNGLESVLGHPIKDFGGVFLSLSIGGFY